MTRTATVFNIERFSSEDGPGIRTVVFLKGCPLRCKWCANPESQSRKPQILGKPFVCVGCARCANICPQKGITRREGMGFVTDAKVCTLCGTCVDGCYIGARLVMGEEYTAAALHREIVKDAAYYLHSGGGVTFSGGEPLLHDDFIVEYSDYAREGNFGMLVETCGQVPLASVRKASAVADGVFFDFKHIDPGRHRELTGADNRQILENLEWLDGNYSGFLSVRYPYIPGMNDDPEAIGGFIDFVAKLGNVREVWFLPYHRLGLSKYRGLGREYEMGDAKPLKMSDIEFLKDYQDRLSIPIRI
ncbi:MAG: glycyl-radical enzyme activating protein [Planctomycetota bacterium]|jgi:pyruvate formate lyase activating enzyme|nr:glycyl-radical enzyme activating protein [Planctomycetota bacterium]